MLKKVECFEAYTSTICYVCNCMEKIALIEQIEFSKYLLEIISQRREHFP